MYWKWCDIFHKKLFDMQKGASKMFLAVLARTRRDWKKTHDIASLLALPLAIHIAIYASFAAYVQCIKAALRTSYCVSQASSKKGNVGLWMIGFWGGRERQRYGWVYYIPLQSAAIFVHKTLLVLAAVIVVVCSRMGVETVCLCLYLASSVVWATNAQSSDTSWM